VGYENGKGPTGKEESTVIPRRSRECLNVVY